MKVEDVLINGTDLVSLTLFPSNDRMFASAPDMAPHFPRLVGLYDHIHIRPIVHAIQIFAEARSFSRKSCDDLVSSVAGSYVHFRVVFVMLVKLCSDDGQQFVLCDYRIVLEDVFALSELQTF